MPEPRGRTRSVVVLAAVAVLTGCSSGGAPGSGGGDGDESAPLAGARLDFVVPYDPGGGYDTYARAMAPYLEECLDARIVVRNEPGAGGLVATNKTAAAPADADRFQIVNTVGLVSAEIAGAEGANFSLEDLNWLGRVAAPPNVLVVGEDSRFDSYADLVSAEETVRFVAQGPGANDYIAPNILGAAYGFPFEVVTGFAGSPEARAAVVAGDADAHVLPVDSQLGAIEAGDVRALVTIDEEPDPLLPDVPTIYEAAAPEGEAQAVIDDLVALGQTGRAVVASPAMPEEKVTALREALGCAMEDAELLAELERQQRPLAPLGGEETAALVSEVLAAPEEFRQLVVDSY